MKILKLICHTFIGAGSRHKNLWLEKKDCLLFMVIALPRVSLCVCPVPGSRFLKERTSAHAMGCVTEEPKSLRNLHLRKWASLCPTPLLNIKLLFFPRGDTTSNTNAVCYMNVPERRIDSPKQRVSESLVTRQTCERPREFSPKIGFHFFPRNHHYILN